MMGIKERFDGGHGCKGFRLTVLLLSFSEIYRTQIARINTDWINNRLCIGGIIN